MTAATLRTRLTHSLADPAMRAKVLALVGGKMIGLILLLTAMRVFIAPVVHADAGQPTAGIWGMLSLGLFATGADGLPTPMGADTSTVVKGPFYGGGTAQLLTQFIGSGAVTAATLVSAFALMDLVKATGTLRVSREGELLGIDAHEHGMVAYPGYVIHGYDPTPHQVASAERQPVPAAPQPVTVRPS